MNRNMIRTLQAATHLAPHSKLDVLLGLTPRIIRGGITFLLHIREGRFQRSLSLIAGLSMFLSGFSVANEHYRAGYGLQVMYTPVLVSPLLIAAGIWGMFSRRAARLILPIVSLLTILDGTVGFYYHLRGIARRPGGWRLPVVNVVMGAPPFAPLLFALSGYLGLIASLLRRPDEPAVRTPLARFAPYDLRPRPAWMSILPRQVGREGIKLEQEIREGRFQQHLAASAAISALLSGFEATYAHYTDDFHHRPEWTPLIVAPLLAAAGFATIPSRLIGRTLLPLTSLLAIADGVWGFYFHGRTVLSRARRTGDPAYNVMYGPPLFAPLLFAASGFMGLLASLLRRA